MSTPSRLAASSYRRGRSPGFTVVELIVTLLLFSVVLTAVLALFELNTRVSNVQIDISDMQQSQRVAQNEIVRLTRMAGRGGLPPGALPGGLAVAVDNDVADPTYIDGDGQTFKVMTGTDILTVRGVLSTPVYSIVPDSFNVDLVSGIGSLELTNQARPGVPVPQELFPFEQALAQGIPEALILGSDLDDAFHIVELDPIASVADESSANVVFRVFGGVNTAAYMALSGGAWDPLLTEVGSVGILEEHRFYIQEERAVPGDPGSDLKPRLARARVYPGTDAPYAGQATNWHVEIADGIVDLQVALGIDTAVFNPVTGEFEPPDGILVDDGGPADEWLFNHPGDDPDDPAWQGDLINPSRLWYVRVSTLAVTERRDLSYRAFREIDGANAIWPVALEDRIYAVDGAAPYHDGDGLRHRRRAFTTVVDLRNSS
jgi:type II secretory pathway pseudopilin PulG